MWRFLGVKELSSKTQHHTNRRIISWVQGARIKSQQRIATLFKKCNQPREGPSFTHFGMHVREQDFYRLRCSNEFDDNGVYKNKPEAHHPAFFSNTTWCLNIKVVWDTSAQATREKKWFLKNHFRRI